MEELIETVPDRKRLMLAIMFIGYLSSDLCELSREEVASTWMELDSTLRPEP